jgi:hypothetical protein
VDTKLKDLSALSSYLDSCSSFDAVVDNNTKVPSIFYPVTSASMLTQVNRLPI